MVTVETIGKVRRVVDFMETYSELVLGLIATTVGVSLVYDRYIRNKPIEVAPLSKGISPGMAKRLARFQAYVVCAVGLAFIIDWVSRHLG
jgi:hypothetical protein